jgi:hypothetical protein
MDKAKREQSRLCDDSYSFRSGVESTSSTRFPLGETNQQSPHQQDWGEIPYYKSHGNGTKMSQLMHEFN